MDKNRISNHNWICRTLTGTIALEETSMTLKQRNFLRQLSKPVRVSDLYKILKEKYPNDYSRTSDFVEIVNFTNKKIWIEKVEKPQLLEESDSKKDDSEHSLEDSRDSSSLPEELLNLSRKAQSGYSEESNVFAVEFEDPEEKEDIKKWFNEADEYEEQQVEFIHDEQTKDLILKLGLGSVNSNNMDEFEIPEDNPFISKGGNVSKTEAAEQVLNFLDQFDEKDLEDNISDEEDSEKEIFYNQEENINQIFNQEKEIVEDKENIHEVEQKKEEDNVREILSVDRESKRQERLSKRNNLPPIKKNEPKKEQGILGSLKNGIKKIIGK